MTAPAVETYSHKMKRTIIFGILSLAMLATGPSVSAQTRAEIKAQKQAEKARVEAARAEAVRKAIEDRNFVIRTDRVFPSRGKSYALNSAAYLSVRDDVVRSQLPYIGRLYSYPLMRDEGLHFFDTPLQDYRVQEGRKGISIVTFSTETREERYSIRIEIYPNGSATINIYPKNRQNIMFSGEMDFGGQGAVDVSVEAGVSGR